MHDSQRPPLKNSKVTVEASGAPGTFNVLVDGHVAGDLSIDRDSGEFGVHPLLDDVFVRDCLEGVRTPDAAQARLQAEVDAGRARRPLETRLDRHGDYWCIEIGRDWDEVLYLSPHGLHLLRCDLDRIDGSAKAVKSDVDSNE